MRWLCFVAIFCRPRDTNKHSNEQLQLNASIAASSPMALLGLVEAVLAMAAEPAGGAAHDPAPADDLAKMHRSIAHTAPATESTARGGR